MLSRLCSAGVAVISATSAVIIGKGYYQTVKTDATANTGRDDAITVHLSTFDTTKDFEKAIDAARELVLRRKEECGAPGVTIAVTKHGRPVWAEGFGYADVENLTAMTPRHVLRIASISKPMTMALVGRAVDAGLLDPTATVHHYLPHYPRHTVDGEPADITVDQVAMHQAGIRHYHKKPEVHILKKKAETSRKLKLAHEILEEEKSALNSDTYNDATSSEGADRTNDKEDVNANNMVQKQTPADRKTDKSKSDKELPAKVLPAKELHTTEKYHTVGEALRVFKDDELIHKPGSGFHYSTHGYTLLSAVLEAVTGVRFTDQLKQMFHAMDLRYTCVDENDIIIRNRARYYVRRNGRLQNAPHVDNSWKIAGGGLLSTPSDLCRFGDTVLYSWQRAGGEGSGSGGGSGGGAGGPVGYLRPQTARWLWTPPEEPARPPGSPPLRRHWSPYRYARGWQVRPRAVELGAGPGSPAVACHTGGAAGCSSILLVRPDGESAGTDGRPRGVTVAVIVNIDDADLRGIADDVARLFAD